MPQPVNGKEYLVEFDEGLDQETTLAALALQRGRVIQGGHDQHDTVARGAMAQHATQFLQGNRRGAATR